MRMGVYRRESRSLRPTPNVLAVPVTPGDAREALSQWASGGGSDGGVFALGGRQWRSGAEGGQGAGRELTISR